jgi:hypothetical protein
MPEGLAEGERGDCVEDFFLREICFANRPAGSKKSPPVFAIFAKFTEF